MDIRLYAQQPLDWNDGPWDHIGSFVTEMTAPKALIPVLGLLIPQWANASQLAFLAPIMFNGPACISHCSQWTIPFLILVHTIRDGVERE